MTTHPDDQGAEFRRYADDLSRAEVEASITTRGGSFPALQPQPPIEQDTVTDALARLTSNLARLEEALTLAKLDLYVLATHPRISTPAASTESQNLTCS